MIELSCAARVAPEKRCIPACLPRSSLNRELSGAVREVDLRGNTPSPGQKRENRQPNSATEPRNAPSFQSVLSNAVCREAFDKLVSEGADRDEVETLVMGCGTAAALPRRWDALWVSGMSRAELSSFPQKIQYVATVIERIGKHPFLPPREPGLATWGTMVSLLRNYANELQSELHTIRDHLRRNRGYFDLWTIFRVKLLSYVKQTTGEYHVAEVSELLSAALGHYEDVGRKPRVKQTDVTPDSLWKLVQRRRNPKTKRSK